MIRLGQTVLKYIFTILKILIYIYTVAQKSKPQRRYFLGHPVDMAFHANAVGYIG